MPGFECLFCGRTDRRSREHVLRNKFNRTFPAHLRLTEISNMVVTGEETRRSSMPISQFDVTVRQVCEPCNNGWLNDLENAVESTLEQFIVEPPGLAWVQDPEALALWMYIRALMRTCTEKIEARAPVELFREIYESRRTPKRALIHCAVTNEYDIQGGRYSWGVVNESSESARLTEQNYLGVVSFGFGSLFFQVWICGLYSEVRRRCLMQRRWLTQRFPHAFHLVFPYDSEPAIHTVLTGQQFREAAAVFPLSMGLADPLHGFSNRTGP